MKKFLDWCDAESGATETAILVIIFLLVVGSLVLAGMRLE